jgi:hypothetical protein
VVAALLMASTIANGQEAIRMSVAGQAAAEAQKKAGDLHYYNVAMGPVSLRFQSATGIELNDNVNYSRTDRVSDLALRPGVNMRAYWPITENNSLFFSTGIGYTKYLKTTSLDHLDITPDSNLAFRMYVGDFAINFHDRFSITEDIQQNPTVSGTGNFNQIENTVGTHVDWDLNELIVSFGYDHDLVTYPNSAFEASDRSSDLFNAAAAFKVNASTTAGLQAGGGLTYYSHNQLSDNTHYSIGPFYQAQITDYIKATASLGYVSYFFSASGTTNSLPGQSGGYADLTFSHRVNRWLEHSLSGGRQFSASAGTDLLDLYYASYAANWHFIRDVSVTTSFSYQHGSSSGGSVEIFNQYVAGLGLGYQITQKLSGSIQYNYRQKSSDVTANDYFQNELVLDFTYSF